MEKISKEQMQTALVHYKTLGLPKSKTVKGDSVVDLYRILGAKPEVDENGKRKLTPYEILGVPPQFDENKQEKPIVFAIKNRTKKIGNYTGKETTFFYESHRVKEEHSLIETLKAAYKKAVLMGNEADAAKYLDLIDRVTGGGAQEFLESFYDYTRFYRKMKKQLLLDIFSHFFLMYMMSRSKQSIIQKGIIRRTRVYRAYKERGLDDEYESEYSEELNRILASQAVPDFPMIKSVKIEQNIDEFDLPVAKPTPKVDVAPQKPAAPKFVVPEPVQVPVEPEPVKEEKVEPQVEQVKYPTSLKDFFAGLQDYVVDDDLELVVGESGIPEFSDVGTGQAFDQTESQTKEIQEKETDKARQEIDRKEQEKKIEMEESQGFDFQA